MKRMLFLALVAFVMGCTFYQPVSDASNAVNFSFNGTGDSRGIGRPNCTIMLCRNEGGWQGGWFTFIFPGLIFSESTLYLGRCWFEHKTPAELQAMLDSFALPGEAVDAWPPANNKIYPRYFMYGQGSSFAEFDEANSYCYNNMSMAIKWLVWDGSGPPHVPTLLWEVKYQRDKAECYLRANVIPVYIFYTNSSAIDPLNIRRFAQNFERGGDEVGPVIISPEFSYDLGKPGVEAAVVNSVRNITEVCDKCLIMLAPPEEDMASLNTILYNYPDVNASVDIIGQGWTLNADENCSVHESLMSKLWFSRKILENHHKPTLWAYFAFSNGSNFGNTCNWTPRRVSNAIDLIYTNTPALVSVGGIGMANYQLLDDSGPFIECSGADCIYGLMKRDESQKHPMFNITFERCRDYYEVGNFSRVPIVFNYWGDNGTTCDAMGQLGTYRFIEVATTPSTHTGDVQRPAQIYTCDRCFSDLREIRQYYKKTPGYTEESPTQWLFAFSPFKDDVIEAVKQHPTTDTIDCDKYHASIRKQAEVSCQWEMDPLFVRAVATRDSGIDPCHVTYVPVGDTSCNTANIVGPPYNAVGPITDPTGSCPDTRTDVGWDNTLGRCVIGGTGGQCKPCTYGSMRCTEYPDAFGAYSGKEPYTCGPEFNPFDTQMGLCCGTNRLCDAIDSAATWAYANNARRIELNLSSNPDDWFYQERDKWTILTLALAVYKNNNQNPNNLLDYYYNHWRMTRWCPSSLDEGPSKTYTWTYCYAYNDSGSVFYGTLFTNPWQHCAANSPDGMGGYLCHLACCNRPPASPPGLPVTTVDLNGERAGYLYGRRGSPGTQSMYPFYDDVEMPSECHTNPSLCACVTNFECCQELVCYGYDDSNPDSWGCNTVGSCCGGSFLEHVCCLEPYACEVLSDYNKTVSQCEEGRFCKRFVT